MRNIAVLLAAAALAVASCAEGKTETVTVEAPATKATPPAPAAATAGPALGATVIVDLTAIDPAVGGYGKAEIHRRRGPDRIALEALMPEPSGDEEAFEAWLYNSSSDVVSLGAQVSDANGDFAGQARLPANWRDYRYVDISLEPIDDDEGHSGESLLRGRISASSP